ncbi:ParB/RepB/Spo0J family partition protein [Arachidicoccus ginsenosidivorans]|jgi:ParB family chromosome partitioning protein|uniref:ParB/RepB/Spo0J family partition protein n=1 Tax=Arachidicoccus ginsenosidivorans TaxID=496057 RepID=A0A5B8VNM1_9BACT|nr:ParB/RepB/Spo0J family partition protein [Arachidicoccus ginsenosidivorans]QEC73204.1 ParB/RepB/Spo0J family partition protein [Arachidicoccus ginsenosidivorans]
MATSKAKTGLNLNPNAKAKPKQGKEALGKGIRSLLDNIHADLKTTSGNLNPKVVEEATTSLRIPVESIEVNPRNPRNDFDEKALKELAASITIHDIIQPLTVSKLASGTYRLIAGERRFRAAKIAGLKDVPVYIRNADDGEILELALLENLQREDLNAIEISLSYQRMMDELGYTQEQVAERMGKERSTVANYIRLLKLPPDVQLAVRFGIISMGHARALISLDLVDKQLYAFKEIKEKGLSVRQTEALVRQMQNEGSSDAKPKAATAAAGLPPAYKKIEDQLASHFGTKVKLAHSKKGNGSILIEYYSLQELNKLLDTMNVQIG